MKLLYFLAITLFVSNTSANAQNASKMTSSTKIYNQKIEFNVPEGWNPVFENTTPEHYILEFVPKGQTKEEWSEMFTVQGFKGLAQKVEPQILLAITGKTHKDLCGDQMVFNLMEPTVVSKHSAQSAIIGCASINKDHPSGLKSGMSEIAYYTAVKGSEDIYLFHKSKRDLKFNVKNPPLNKLNAENFISNFMPIKLCNGKSKFHECLK